LPRIVGIWSPDGDPKNFIGRERTGTAHVVIGIAAGFGIGVVASLLGVAGGELLIPTLVLLFGTDIKLAGSLSLAVSLPTMLPGSTRYSTDKSFALLGKNRGLILVMAAGSLFGAFLGGQLLGIVPGAVLLPFLTVILVISGGENLASWIMIQPFAMVYPLALPFYAVTLDKSERKV